MLLGELLEIGEKRNKLKNKLRNTTIYVRGYNKNNNNSKQHLLNVTIKKDGNKLGKRKHSLYLLYYTDYTDAQVKINSVYGTEN